MEVSILEVRLKKHLGVLLKQVEERKKELYLLRNGRQDFDYLITQDRYINDFYKKADEMIRGYYSLQNL